MEQIDIVREIIDTYDLSNRDREKIVRTAIRQVNAQGLNTYDKIYRYVDNLIETFQVPFVKPKIVSLDLARGGDLDTNLHNAIGREDSNIAALFDSDNLDTAQILGHLRGQLSDVDFSILIRLSGETSDIFRITPEEFALLKDQFVAQLPKVRERIEVLAARYGRDGKIVLPKRPIAEIQFEPDFLLRFGRRGFEGNPLAFFREHKDVYQGLSRSDLSRFDASLYTTLLRHSQMEDAIPERRIRPRIFYRGHESPLAYFMANGERFKGMNFRDLREADSRLADALYRRGQDHVAIPTMRRMRQYRNNPIAAFQANVSLKGLSRSQLKKTDQSLYVKLRKTGQLEDAIPEVQNPLPASAIENIVAAYVTYNGNATKAAEQVHYDPITIRKYWKSAGLKSKGKRDSTLNPEDVKTITDAHGIYKGNATEASRHLTYSAYQIRRCWKDANLK